MSNKFLQVGDVFKAASLATANFAHRDGIEVDRKRLEVGGASEVTVLWTEKGKDGWERSREDVVNLNGHDPSRGDAEFVVINTEMSGGGTGHGPHDVYPDGWGVLAKRLTSDGQFDPKGEKVFFRQSGCFNNMLEDIVKTRKMKQKFV